MMSVKPLHELPPVAGQIPANKPNDAPSKGGALRLLTIDALDGRTQAAKEARAMRSAIIRDLTGSDDETALSAIRLALVEAFAVQTAIINDANVRWLRGDPVNLSEITTLSNARNRTATMLGLDRVMRDVTDLDSYLAGSGA